MKRLMNRIRLLAVRAPALVVFKFAVATIAAQFALPAAASDTTPPPLSEGGHFVEKDGAALYGAICQGCHMPQGQGAKGAGMYPALAANPRLASAAYPAYTVLHGRNGMPGFAERLSDEQVAEAVNYVRSHFGNHYTDPLTAADVAKLR
ncbi:cytochrome C oxidase [Pandoraea terrae]|uniref:Cytochrome C oxidase n=1 Tax=Pandoraea terrae TaxID=1537710 RepID=A0A5E4TIQ5_9BURK|nr:cytochrome c [Pandoraea terrae]VVD86368.1 cytochrome C oxidase [Pandoraea terrae]